MQYLKMNQQKIILFSLTKAIYQAYLVTQKTIKKIFFKGASFCSEIFLKYTDLATKYIKERKIHWL